MYTHTLMHTHTYPHTYAHPHTHTLMHTHTPTHLCTPTHPHTHAHPHTHTLMHTHTPTHTHACTCTHTHTHILATDRLLHWVKLHNSISITEFGWRADYIPSAPTQCSAVTTNSTKLVFDAGWETTTTQNPGQISSLGAKN